MSFIHKKRYVKKPTNALKKERKWVDKMSCKKEETENKKEMK